jgi:hypothetical protein
MNGLSVSRDDWEKGDLKVLGWYKRICGDGEKATPTSEGENSWGARRMRKEGFVVIFFFWVGLGLYSGLHACKAGTIT